MRLLPLFLFLIVSTAIWAQPKFNSPYSSLGIGDIVPAYFANQAGWGGQTAAFHDPYHLNLANPASYAYLRTTAFETGINGKYGKYVSNSNSQTEWSGNLSHIALGFTLKSPINEVLDKVKSPWNYGMGIALTPYSRVGYDIETRDTLPGLEDIQNSFQGSGGLYRIVWTGAAKYKNTALGANMGWVFGQVNYDNTTFFHDTSAIQLPTFQDNYRQNISASGFVWDLGVQHDIVLKHSELDKDIPTRWITLGLSGHGKHELKAYEGQFQIRSRGQQTNGSYYDADTLTAFTDQRRKLTLPAAFSFGVQYVKANKLKLGAQIGFESWSGYVNEARPSTFTNTVSVSGGIEYIPAYSSFNKPLRRVRYRTGAYFHQDPRYSEQNLTDIGITLGVGLPVVLPRQQTSFVNLSLEIGKLGTSSPIEETYVRFTAGFTLNDNTWFYKRRFE